MKSLPPDAEPYNTYTFYVQTRDTLKKIIDMINTKGAKYNLQSCQKFVLGCLQHELAATTSTDILQYAYQIGGAPYGSVVEIDPRYKTEGTYTYNIADVAKLIDSTGAKSSKTLGGFVHYVDGTAFSGGDWTTYTATIPGTLGTPWTAEILWGAGSNPPHKHDANNYGIWKPRGKADSLDFYCHNPAQNFWVQGNGCSWVLTPTTNVNQMISEIRTEATKIKNGTYPSNKYFNATLMINFKDFTNSNYPAFQMRATLSRVIDSINFMKNQGLINWKTITQKQAAFQAWSTANSISYSQWRCGQTTTLAPTCVLNGINESVTTGNDFLKLSPNPASQKLNVEWQGQLNNNTVLEIYDALGRNVYREKIIYSITSVSVDGLKSGIYTVIMRNDAGQSKPEKVLISH